MEHFVFVAYADRRSPKINTSGIPIHETLLFRFRCFALVGCLCFGLLPMFVQADEKSPERWEKSIVEIEQRIASGKSAPGSALFIGSSSIRLWKLEDSFPDLATVNHGFGGSFLSDSVHFLIELSSP